MRRKTIHSGFLGKCEAEQEGVECVCSSPLSPPVPRSTVHTIVTRVGYPEILPLKQAGDFTVDPVMTESARALLDCLLELDPKKRFTVEQVRSHPWFLRDRLDESRRVECHPTFSVQQQQQQQQPGVEGDPVETASRCDGRASVAHEDGDEEENRGAKQTNSSLREPGAVAPSHRQEPQTAAALPAALPPSLPRLRQVVVFDVDDDFNGTAEAAAFLYGDDEPSARASSPPSGFNSPVSGLESLVAGDPPCPARRRRSETSVFESIPSFGTPISGFTALAVHGAAGSSSSLPSDERSRRLDTFSSYAVSDGDRSRLVSASTCSGELYGEEDEEEEEEPPRWSRAREEAVAARASFLRHHLHL